MDYQKLSYEELSQKCFDNPPDEPVCQQSFAEM